MRPRDAKSVRRLRRAGFVYPVRTVWAARKAGISIASAAALLEKESYRGKNVFGHDVVANPVKGGAVTKRRYAAYKRYRKAGKGMQGVGPCQLTWYEFQDRADALGGCWRPAINMLVGFQLLRQLVRDKGLQQGAAAYNGQGAAAQAYGRDFVEKKRKWQQYFSR